jgi:hypothetical protein
VAGVQLGRIGPRPARTQGSVHNADSAIDLVGRPGDRGSINKQQFADHFLCDIGAETHDDRFHRLRQG